MVVGWMAGREVGRAFYGDGSIWRVSGMSKSKETMRIVVRSICPNRIVVVREKGVCFVMECKADCHWYENVSSERVKNRTMSDYGSTLWRFSSTYGF